MLITLLVVVSLFVLPLASCQGGSPSDVSARLPPTIIIGPDKGDYYRSDDEFTLECKAHGVPEVSYKWKRNGVNLNLNGHNVKREIDGTITINQATSVDAGVYQCIARNQFGTALTNTSFMQMIFLDRNGSTQVSTKNVTEGKPFCIEAQPTRSNPKPSSKWEKAEGTVDKYPELLSLTKRIQIAENGDLCFAYAKPEDDLETYLYKITEYDEQTDIMGRGSYTKVTVNRVPGGPKPFSPTLNFSSKSQTVAVEGQNPTLWCFFSGNPEPDLAWSGPNNLLPTDRYLYVDGTYKTRLTIQNVQPSDEGDYICSATNTMGSNKHTVQMRVAAVPRFLSIDDQPHDTNVTEGVSLTFKCYTYAKPEATVIWLRNGQPLDLNQLPRRYRISDDKKLLTIENLCRDCTDRPESRQSDLGVIQCNASNRHGHAFAAGYVNVLLKTSVLVFGEKEVSVEMKEEKQFTWVCIATSDPSTPPRVRWFKEIKEGGDKMVYEQPPVLLIRDGVLNIHVVPNKTQGWETYKGMYRCDGENGYSKESVYVVLRIVSPAGIEKYWWMILLILLVLLFILSICVCCICWRRRKRDKSDDDIKKQAPKEVMGQGRESPDSLYDTIDDGVESFQDGHPPISDYTALKGRDLSTASSTYAELRLS